jgi:hypothetical protein
MDKNTEIKFVGQPVFKQILNLINQVNIQGLIINTRVTGITRHSRPARI